MAGSSPTSPVAGHSRWLALVVLCAGMLMIVLDATIVNVALPSIRNDLGFAQLSFGIGAALVLLALVIAGTVLRPAEAANEDSVPKRRIPLGDVAQPGARVR